MFTDNYLVLSQCMRLTNGRTERQTERKATATARSNRVRCTPLKLRLAVRLPSLMILLLYLLTVVYILRYLYVLMICIYVLDRVFQVVRL